jgi:chaperone modulatory protein CbpM
MAATPQRAEELLLDERVEYTLGELGRASGLPADHLIQLVEVGILEPLPYRHRWCFTGPSVTRLQTALRLQSDLGVNPEGAALALDLLDELNRLRRWVACNDPHAQG